MEIEINGRVLVLTINGEALIRMFDAAGEETFDFTETVEVETDDGLRPLEEGDEIAITFDGPA